ncbi:hypothetical protein QR98_0038080 [Sarcoptes scabiei]|uniref:Epg5-like central TPR repeats domain-containing protein n=1 Tax=Sarcoptes scabiei TaxID=52283 RepID=A0A132A2T5_SARSC|nr:hypothetical protein QR98_0038080 [Sarcoptes scabiei]
MLQIYLLKLIPLEGNSLKCADTHPLLPLIWKQFFTNFFFQNDLLSAIGTRFINVQLLRKLTDRLNALFDYHNQRWIRMNNEDLIHPNTFNLKTDDDSISQEFVLEERILRLYRTFRIWIKDNRLLKYADLDDEQFSNPEFQIKLLSSILSSNKAYNLDTNPINLWAKSDSTNSFFFRNYLNKSSIQKLITKAENYFLDKIKSPSDLTKDHDSAEHSLLKQNSIEEVDLCFKTSDRVEVNLERHSIECECFHDIIDYFTKLTNPLNYGVLFKNETMTFMKPESMIKNNIIKNDFRDAPIVFTTSLRKQGNADIFFCLLTKILVFLLVSLFRFIENQFEKLAMLNSEFCKTILPELYVDESKSLVRKIPCDKGDLDQNGCAQLATIKINFIETVLNDHVQLKYDRNRMGFDAVIASLIEDVPGDKVVASIYVIQKICLYLLEFFDDQGDPKSQQNQTMIQSFLATMSGWINSINLIGLKYHITGQLLDIFLETLNKLSFVYFDEINYFYLSTALQRSLSLSLIQQITPLLNPSKTSSSTFIEMYKLIGSHLNTTISQQTVFVLLTKFDVVAWLRSPNLREEHFREFQNCLFQCLTFFGINPSDEYLVTFDIYRKHFQDIILHQFPTNLPKIISSTLQKMATNSIAPTLWNSVLHTFGFYTKSLSSIAMLQYSTDSDVKSNENERENSIPKNLVETSATVIDFNFKSFDEDLKNYLLRNKIFTSHEVYDLFQVIIEIKYQFASTSLNHCEYLDHFKNYNFKFLQFLSFISYCWINFNSTSIPDDLKIIWEPFFEAWRIWIFPMKSTKFIQWDHFCFAWQLLINSIQFMLDTFYDHQSQIFSFFWQQFYSFVLNTTSIKSTDIEMFESKILLLSDWSNFIPDIIDMKLLFESISSANQSLKKLNAFVISKLQWNRIDSSSSLLRSENCVETMEKFLYAIISLAEESHIQTLEFSSIPFNLLPIETTQTIFTNIFNFIQKRPTTQSIVFDDDRMTAELHSNLWSVIAKLSKSLVLLDRDSIVDKNIDYSAKVSCYAHFIASIVTYNCNQTVEDNNPALSDARNILKDFFDTLKNKIDGKNQVFFSILPLILIGFNYLLFIDFSSEDRVIIFSQILQCLNDVQNESVRNKLSTHINTLFSYLTTSQFFADAIVATNKTISDTEISLSLLESMIENYFDLAGDLSKICDLLNEHSKFNFRCENPWTTEVEGFIQIAIRMQSYLFLSIHILSLLRNKSFSDHHIREYAHNFIKTCHQQFKLSNFITPIDEPKICFFWMALLDLLTFDHSAMNSSINISMHQISLVNSNPTLSLISESGSLMDSSMVFTEIASGINRQSARIVSSSTSKIVIDFQDENVANTLQSLLELCRVFNAFLNDSINRKFLDLFKHRKIPGSSCLLLFQCMILHATHSIFECFFPEVKSSIDSENFKNEKICKIKNKNIEKFLENLWEIYKIAEQRSQTFRKNKKFQNNHSLFDHFINLLKYPNGLNLSTINQNNQTSNNCDKLQSNDFQSDRYHMELSLENYVMLLEHQQNRFHTLHQWLLDFFPDKNYLKHIC